ncbi:hypothetical protein HPP92_017253 [Vanilla planifolia]|uniref:LIM zinc-binding domain-containing protein n=1 Tax=Vanilla planifolia TaxID=51239 RepID=A0A835QC10_VANPL|nr:hypothetical protein HPP92_017253 [Vanilla planifolia]
MGRVLVSSPPFRARLGKMILPCALNALFSRINSVHGKSLCRNILLFPLPVSFHEPEPNLVEDEQLARALQENLNTDLASSSKQKLSSSSEWRIYSPSSFFFPIRSSCLGAVWHPDCFRYYACDRPITDDEFSMYGDHPYHKSCYRNSITQNAMFIPTNMNGLIEYRAHPFWMQKYCPSHEHDGTQGLNMKVDQQIPLLLVERQALNEAMEGEKRGHHHLPETRGLCMSEEQIVSTVSRRPRLSRSQPRNRRRHLSSPCSHVVGLEIMSGSGSNIASSSSSSSGPSKKGARSQFERKLGDFFKHQIESDSSPAYGDGFRAGNEAVLKYGLRVL